MYLMAWSFYKCLDIMTPTDKGQTSRPQNDLQLLFVPTVHVQT
jgi:hypothetical protein